MYIIRITHRTKSGNWLQYIEEELDNYLMTSIQKIYNKRKHLNIVEFEILKKQSKNDGYLEKHVMEIK